MQVEKIHASSSADVLLRLSVGEAGIKEHLRGLLRLLIEQENIRRSNNKNQGKSPQKSANIPVKALRGRDTSHHVPKEK